MYRSRDEKNFLKYTLMCRRKGEKYTEMGIVTLGTADFLFFLLDKFSNMSKNRENPL